MQNWKLPRVRRFGREISKNLKLALVAKLLGKSLS